MGKKGRASPGLIVENRAAKHTYFIESHLEGGLVLEGWEVKALRARQVNIKESYAIIKKGEAFLIGASVNPLSQACSHVVAEPGRTRKLLFSRRELSHLQGVVMRKGYTLVPLKLYWSRSWIKLQLGLCKGKQGSDKRQHEKNRDWQRMQQHLLKKLG